MPVHTGGNVISVSLPRSTAAFELARFTNGGHKYADPKVDNANPQKHIPHVILFLRAAKIEEVALPFAKKSKRRTNRPKETNRDLFREMTNSVSSEIGHCSKRISFPTMFKKLLKDNILYVSK